MNNEQYYNQLHLSSKVQGAFLGAAVGDALGWVQEMPHKRVDKQLISKDEISTEFQQWVRRSGGRYYPHKEVIGAGEYSDDTQLILCTARSLFHGPQWWEHFTKREITAWYCYERGGGGATKKAIKDWLDGVEPWSSVKNKRQYFEAGGNGVAMRILPHCLLGLKELSFKNTARNIFENGICTHGHPRALVGALAYGFSVWTALKINQTLSYGEIIERVLTEIDVWSKLTEFGSSYGHWKNQAEEAHNGKYEECWIETVEEMRDLLNQCHQAMKQGSLSIEGKLLKQMGCFSKYKGSGTISAAAAIFLASRYAANPKNGLIEAAFAHGADTDTIASMTGGILGAIAGNEWLQEYDNSVQDSQYIKDIAEKLRRVEDTDNHEFSSISRTNKVDIYNFRQTLETMKQSQTLDFLDGRQVKILNKINHESLSVKTVAMSWKLIADDGQTLYIQKLSHSKNNTSNSDESIKKTKLIGNISEVSLKQIDVLDNVVRLTVKDLEESRFFYQKILGIKVQKESAHSVRCGNLFLFQSAIHSQKLNNYDDTFFQKHVSIYIKVSNLDDVYHNAFLCKASQLVTISERKGRRFFHCLDPDNNQVEVFEEEF